MVNLSHKEKNIAMTNEDVYFASFKTSRET